MQILFFRAGKENTASTRIRIYSILAALQERQIQYLDRGSYRNVLKSQVLFIQKRLSPRTIALARFGKLIGKKIIYDVEDLGPALRSWGATPELLHKMLILADVVTTGSEAQRSILRREYPTRQFMLLPAAVDYYPQQPLPCPDLAEDELRIIWFGVVSNAHMLQPYLAALMSIPRTSLVMVVNNGAIPDLSQKFPGVQFEAWVLQSFTSVLRTCHLSVLMHDGSEYDQAKTNNRMITSITWGVPAVVSRTPDYEATAQKAGVEEALFSNTDELVRAVERLRTATARQRYLEKAQPVIWREHSPQAITDAFLKICQEIQPDPVYKRIKDVLSTFRINHSAPV
jgi:hypothetical protein